MYQQLISFNTNKRFYKSFSRSHRKMLQNIAIFLALSLCCGTLLCGASRRRLGICASQTAERSRHARAAPRNPRPRREDSDSTSFLPADLSFSSPEASQPKHNRRSRPNMESMINKHSAAVPLHLEPHDYSDPMPARPTHTRNHSKVTPLEPRDTVISSGAYSPSGNSKAVHLLHVGSPSFQVPDLDPSEEGDSTIMRLPTEAQYFGRNRCDTYTSTNNSETTASQMSSLSETVEEEILKQLNLARTDPQRYAKEVIEPLFDTCVSEGRTVYNGEKYIIYAESEGRAAIQETIDFLNNQPSRSPLEASCFLTRAAEDHIDGLNRSLQEEGVWRSHLSRDGSGPPKRVAKYCQAGSVGECVARSIAFVPSISPVAVARYFVSGFIIDDRVKCSNHIKGYECMNDKCRGHRHTIFAQIEDATCTHCPFGRMLERLPQSPDWKTVPRFMAIFHMKRVETENPSLSHEEVKAQAKLEHEVNKCPGCNNTGNMRAKVKNYAKFVGISVKPHSTEPERLICVMDFATGPIWPKPRGDETNI